MRIRSFAARALFGALLSLATLQAAHAQTPLACGTDTVATIGVNGEVDTYSFSGVAGEVVAIAVGESAADNFFEPCWQLFAPGGAPVTARVCSGAALVGTIAQVITLAATGTFTIQVSELEGTRTGTYEINWHGLSASNSCGAATTLCGDIGAAVTPGGDIDTFSFTGTAGEVVSIAVGETVADGFFEPCWQLFAPDGSPVNARSCAPSISGVEGTVTQLIALPASGTYTIILNEEDADFRNGSYQLNVHGLSASNTCGAATAFCGDITSESTPGGDIDTYSFTGTAGEVVSIGVGETVDDGFFEPCWQLFAPNGSPVNARSCAPSVSGVEGTVAQLITLPASGTYTIILDEEEADYRNGSYQLNVHGLSASNSCGAPTPFCGDIVSASTPGGDIDTFSFTGTAGEVLAIGIGETVNDGFFDPCWQLFAPTGAPVNALTCAGASVAGTIPQVLTLPASGTYTISVTEAQADFRLGSYELNVHGLSASNGCGAAAPFCTEIASTSTPGGDIDTFAITGTAGDVVSIAIGETVSDGFFDPCWRIFAPDGSALNALTCTATGTAPQAITLPVTGTYTVMVSEAQGDFRLGSFQLEVQGLSANRTCGTPIGCGSDAVATTAQFGDIDSYTFAGVANDVVSLSVGEAPLDGSFDPCVQLFDPSGASVGARACGASNLAAHAVRTLPATGTYTVEISESTGDRAGSYAYSLQKVVPTAQQCSAPTACGIPAVGAVSLRPGDTKTFSFYGGTGNVVSITVSEASTNTAFAPCWQLFAPSGASVGALQCAAASAVANRTLAETGLHTVEVSDQSLAFGGVFTVGLVGPLVAGLCTTPCGNGGLDAGEACDDGNLAGADCCSPICQVVPDGDADTLCDRVDNCPTVANLDQADGADADGVGQACDTCPLVTNPRVTITQRQLWMTLVSGQRDDDADGRGNRCDFDHDNVGTVVTATDFNQGKASVADLVSGNLCGTGNATPCGRFDQDEIGTLITASDFNLLKAAVGKLVPARCGTACTPPFSGAIGKAPCEGPGC